MKALVKKHFPNFNSDLVADIEQHATLQHFKAGDTIIRSGQYIKNTVLVVQGTIKIYREDDDGGEFFMYYLQPGQACAISMICATKQETSAIMAKVVEDAEVLMIPLHLMEKWMAQYRSWYAFVIETYRDRFEEVLLVIDNIAFKAMDERLAFYLQRHSEACQCQDIKLSHQEIATELNTSREVISRLLKKMEQRGLVRLHRSHVELVS
jgi:CRP/FNR family transcriptional regulator, anaerobic regulatory protein